MKKIIAMGELLMDCMIDQPTKLSFQVKPGGAPCNVIAMASKLGCTCSYIAKVGKDVFGYELRDTLSRQGIDPSNILFDEDAPTTLAFVSHDQTGERSFSFYREGCADIKIKSEDIKESWFQKVDIFHFGSLSLCAEPARSATYQALQYAKKHRCICSFDPNLRLSLWKDVSIAREEIRKGCELCDVLKVGEDELFFITEKNTVEEAIAYLCEHYKIALIFVTNGERGSVVYQNQKKIIQPSMLQENVIDTTGAGDTYFGCILAYLSEFGISLQEEKLKEAMQVASIASSIVTTRKGSLCAMPTLEEIQKYKNV